MTLAVSGAACTGWGAAGIGETAISLGGVVYGSDVGADAHAVGAIEVGRAWNSGRRFADLE